MVALSRNSLSCARDSADTSYSSSRGRWSQRLKPSKRCMASTLSLTRCGCGRIRFPLAGRKEPEWIKFWSSESSLTAPIRISSLDAVATAMNQLRRSVFRTQLTNSTALPRVSCAGSGSTKRSDYSTEQAMFRATLFRWYRLVQTISLRYPSLWCLWWAS